MRLACLTTGLLTAGLLITAGCEANKPSPPVVRTLSGSVDTTVPGEARTAAIFWEVSSGSPDYAYKFGEGPVDGGQFSITLPSDPPAEAINSYGLGVGIVAVLLPGTTLPEGRVAAGISAADVLAGVSPDRSVVWGNVRCAVELGWQRRRVHDYANAFSWSTTTALRRLRASTRADR